MDIETDSDSDMQKFYKNKTVFVTGGSGFLGKVIIEKLLRVTDVKLIYVMIRPKKDQDISERFAAWESDPVCELYMQWLKRENNILFCKVFTLLLKLRPKALERVSPIAGDCQEPDLAISDTDRQLLLNEVQLVLHSAATVRFVEPLHIALAINTRAARLMLQLAKQMSRLEVFVHISTAYSNCVVKHIKEEFYPENLSCTAEKVLEVGDKLCPKMIDDISSTLLGKYPNTYTFTKALAEQVVQKEAGDLPICVYRPGVIIASYKEPMSGWIDNLNGPIAVLYGAAFGVLRVSRLNVKAQAGIVPVDYCANMILACAWKTAQENPHQKNPTIYNHVPSEKNLITWGGFRDKSQNLVPNFPLTQMMWCPFLHCTTLPWLFRLGAFFYHILPGFLIDLVLRLRGQKPRMLKIYDKIHKNINILSPFTNTSWSFDTKNTINLWQSLSSRDKVLFKFTMKNIDWDDYFMNALGGMRIYLAKEDPGEDSIKRGQKILRRFLLLHRLLQFIVCSIFAALLWSLFKHLDSL